MKTKIFVTLLIVFAFCFSNVFFAQEIDEKKLERKLKKLEHHLKDKDFELHSIEIPEIQIDLSGLEQSMKHLEFSLQYLEHIEIPEIDIDIPEIHVDIPEIPEIHVDIPEICIPEIEFEFDHFNFDLDFDYDFDCQEFHHDIWHDNGLFDDLTEKEEIKISAIRSMGKQQAEKAIPALNKILENESSPVLRYEAVRQLRKFVDDES
ncbi:HEAT repeat domain-containing protein, partial [candidate division KSB1 bacterium]|nr:HEAT repeat domain-containing protein [candidate division KSB1 bacterium]